MRINVEFIGGRGIRKGLECFFHPWMTSDQQTTANLHAIKKLLQTQIKISEQFQFPFLHIVNYRLVVGALYFICTFLTITGETIYVDYHDRASCEFHLQKDYGVICSLKRTNF